MRQGFGFVLMERGIISSWVIKTCYYVGTMIPFLLFHMREINSKMTSDILNNVDLFYINDYISYNKLCFLYYSLILGFLIFGILKKEYKRLMPFMWFSMLYWYSFVISESQMISYWVLVISHAIPYFWILKNRIIKTHNSSIIKRYADYLLVGLFILGGYLDYLHDGKSIGSNIWFESVFFTPLITHFFIDGILWKKSDPRFKKLMEKNDKTI